ncbi:MAG: hypothetical protein GY822_27185 [Deltaproteobacteria bacterium]|nr:hypothetical protein [Deltaproteobacteria bacterium]
MRLQEGFEGFPQSDLTLLRIYTEDQRYLDTWSKVLARDVKRVTTMGSDCHRNTFPGLLPDGERMDSYRRMMSWFTNHLLIRAEDDGPSTTPTSKQLLKQDVSLASSKRWASRLASTTSLRRAPAHLRWAKKRHLQTAQNSM